MTSAARWALAFAVAGGCAGARADYSSAPLSGLRLAEVSVRAEAGAVVGLQTLMRPDRPTILVPAYFSCHATCPLLAENLRDSLGRSGLADRFNVLFLSFDPGDGAEEMGEFRAHHRLPPGWALSVVRSEADARAVLDAFDYRFQKTDTGFDHPNAAFVLTAKGQAWSGLLMGTDNGPADLVKALAGAEMSDRAGLWPWLRTRAAQPGSVVVYGFAVVALALAAMVVALVSRARRPAAP